jgi:hypothetical protein
MAMKHLVLPTLLFSALAWQPLHAQQSRSAETIHDDEPASEVAAPAEQVTAKQRPVIVRHEASPVPANERLPYEGYKGIEDPEAAKKAWVADHPEQYRKLVGENPDAAPAQQARVPKADSDAGGSAIKATGATQQDNVDIRKQRVEEAVKRSELRRVPKVYDDSSTNVRSK